MARQKKPSGRQSGSRGSLRRSKPHLELGKTILIVCEGKETEPKYFDAFRKAKRLMSKAVTVIGGDQAGTHPKSVVECAKRQVIETDEVYDEVWCVFDRDEHPNIDRAFVQARDNKFKVAFSNPCFELWFVLHYEDCNSDIERDAVRQRLKLHIPEYAKNLDVYDKLVDLQPEAIRRSRTLRKHHHIDEPDCIEENPNPSTWVDRLVESLNEITP